MTKYMLNGTLDTRGKWRQDLPGRNGGGVRKEAHWKLHTAWIVNANCDFSERKGRTSSGRRGAFSCWLWHSPFGAEVRMNIARIGECFPTLMSPSHQASHKDINLKNKYHHHHHTPISPRLKMLCKDILEVLA